VTWRSVPQKWYQRIQIAVLLTTTAVGASIAVTPVDRNVSTLTVIEQAMSADYWAFSLIGLSLVALISELDMWHRRDQRWVLPVSICHILLCSLLVGYSTAALWGVLFRVWWNFGAPTLGLLLAYLHFVFIHRRPETHA
jgi:amino acid transporter